MRSAAVVTERLRFDSPSALTQGEAVAGGQRLFQRRVAGRIEPEPNTVREQGDRLVEGEQLRVDLLDPAVPVVRTRTGFGR